MSRRLRRPSRQLLTSSFYEALEARTLLFAEIVQDINPGLTSTGTPGAMGDVNGTLFFSLFSKLWKSDGTIAGTSQVHPDSTNPTFFTNLNGTLIYAGGGQLWKSDGNTAGTVKLAASTFMNPRDITVAGNRVYFRGNDGGGEELWTSDGTDAGTYRIKDINPGSAGSEPRQLTAVGNTLYFRAQDGSGGLELWKTDGTALGTVQVKDIHAGAGSSDPVSLTNVNGTLFFAAHDAPDSGYELWKSDGTSAGTVRVKDIRPGKPGSSPTSLFNVNGTLMFVATDGATGYELWKSNGTEAGTVLVKDIVAGGASSSIDQVVAVGTTLYFSADAGTGTGIELWKSDGTAAGTVQVKDINPGANPSNPGVMTAHGNKLFFVASEGVHAGVHAVQAWTSDGTSAGTQLLKPSLVSAWPGNFVSSGSKVFFIQSGADGTRSLFVSDGTDAGTTEIPLTIPVGQHGNVGPITKVGSTLYFSATNGTNGQELWKSDGTSAGTQMVVDLVPGAGGSNPTELVNFNGELYFVSQGKLWKTDGTPGGTAAVSNVVMSPQKLTLATGAIYFIGSDSAGQELWKSDGTAAGTARVADVRPGGGSSGIEQLTPVGSSVYFVANDGTHGQEVFKSDGTPGGTSMVKDIIAGAATSGPMLLTNVNGTLFFRASDGASGYELWKSDGTLGGTAMVKDIRPGGDSAVIHLITAVGSTAYFVADDGVHGQELWKSDGTSAGTSIVRDIVPGAHGSTPTNLTEINGELAFRAHDEVNGSLLWKTNGTEAGTQILLSVAQNAPGYDPMRFSNVNGRLVFQARGGAFQNLWISDGTAGGTQQIQIQGQIGAPRTVVELNGEFFFPAFSTINGAELWKVAIPPAAIEGPAPMATTAPTTMPAPIEAAPAAATAPDVFYDATIRPDKPTSSVAGAGMAGIMVVGGSWADFDQQFPDEFGIRNLALQAAAKNVPLVFDIEHLPVDQRNVAEGTLSINLERLMQVADWAKDAAPSIKIGFYGLMPADIYPAPSPGVNTAWHAATQRLAPLVAKIDEVYTVVYTFHPWADATWQSGAINLIAEARTFGKPVVPFLWMQYLGYNPDLSGRLLPADEWRIELDMMRDLADGAILWDAGPAWQDAAPWWTVTRDFLINPTPIAPAKPSGLGAVPQNSQRVNLSWTDNAHNETGWRVQRRLGNSGPFVTVATLAANAAAYSDQSVSAASSYTYRVVAFNAGGESLASNEVSATTPNGSIAPAKPINVAATGLSTTSVRVTWVGGSQNETGFTIERSSVGGEFTPLASVAAGTNSFDDLTAVTGVNYVYRVRAGNNFGQSAWSDDTPGAALVSTKDARGLWALDDATGTNAIDRAGGDNNGTLTSGPTWTSGKLGGALSFDGIDDHVTVADSAALNFSATQNFTLSAWVNLSALPNQRAGVVTRGGNGIWIDATNHWVFGGIGGDITGPLATTGWTHVATVQDGTAGTRKLYVNGVEVASGSAQNADTAGELWIGGNASSSEFFAGKIDDVRLYGSAWSAADVAALANPHVTLTGTSGPDTFVVNLDPLTDNYRFIVNGVTVSTALRDTVASINVLGDSGDDQLAIDFAAGEAMPQYGFIFDGGSGTDTIKIAGNRPGFAIDANSTTFTRGGRAITRTGVERIAIANGILDANTHLGAELVLEPGSIVRANDSQKVSSVVFAGGSLDVRYLNVAIDYTGDSIIDQVNAAIASGRASGQWNGPGIVTSQLDARDPILVRTLVAVEASELFNLSGSQTQPWYGSTIDATSIVLLQAIAGDADLSSFIDGDDYFLIDAGFAAQATGYRNGDFDYNGRIDADDYFLMDANYAISSGLDEMSADEALAGPNASAVTGTAATLQPSNTKYFAANTPVFANAPIESAYDRLLEEANESIVR